MSSAKGPGRSSSRVPDDIAAAPKRANVKSRVTQGRCEAPGCSRALPRGRRRFCSDICRIRGQRAERVTETGDFGRAALRMVRAMARRVSASDIAEFGLMWEIVHEAEHAVTAAIDGLRAKGFTWAEIAAEAGQTRQGLTQWRKRRPAQFEGNDPLREDSGGDP